MAKNLFKSFIGIMLAMRISAHHSMAELVPYNSSLVLFRQIQKILGNTNLTWHMMGMGITGVGFLGAPGRLMNNERWECEGC